MVYVQLTEEEKFHVLLVAFGLFSVALVVSICLASAFCPLNRWLLERNERRKRRRLQWPPAHTGGQRHYHSAGPDSKSSTLSSYAGPPPAYEAALRASRLQSLTGASSVQADWLQEALNCKNGQLNRCPSSAETCQLDLGDYFHQPKGELAGAGASNDHHCIPMEAGIQLSANNRQRQPPVMMRLWVCLLDPADLVARARLSSASNSTPGGGPEALRQKSSERQEARRSSLSLTRQLSIPQLFDSLINLTSRSASSSALCDQANQQEQPPRPEEEQATGAKHQSHGPLSGIEFSSLSSSSSSSTENQPANSKTESTTTTTATRKPDQRPSSSLSTKWPSISPVSSITSRVLHMNVASFSYVKDESLISSKKHNQMNFHHFQSQSSTLAAAANTKKGNSKMCQLLVSICDIENLLSSSWLNERACSKLASSSSIYIQCEILCSKSTATRGLLRNPLKALQQTAANAVNLTTSTTAASATKPGGPSTCGANNDKNTMDFASTLPAAAIEQPPVCPIRLNPPKDEPSGDLSMEQPYSSGCFGQDTQSQTSTNWKHEPDADGKSIVVFQSVPKQIEQQQQLAMDSSQRHSSDDNLNIIDLIQFDSVFVSPILSRSTLDGGHLRLRVYSQCKYVNETCLVELKLPLKQLVKAETGDNLADARTPRPQHQADLILNNLLANLVTASTGSPLSTLIEQISAEEAEEDSRRGGGGDNDEHAKSRNELVIDANRLAANKWSSLTQISKFLNTDESHDDQAELHELGWHDHCQRLIEQNYCRSMLVSHWLNYLVAPSYECQLVEETRGKLVLGLTYLPTSNRLIFNAHRASVELDRLNPSEKQLVKKLRLQSDTLYLVRFMMLANGRVLKRKQSALAAKRPEWDGQEAITFDLVNASVEQPSFLVSFVMRNGQACRAPPRFARSAAHQHKLSGHNGQQLGAKDNNCWPPTMVSSFSEPESLRGSGDQQQARSTLSSSSSARQQPQQSRDFVVGHLVLADELWNELRAQPRRQIVKQFKLM